MAIELKQELRLSQQLVMTPQLQQAIKLLQLSRLELMTTVQQELQENPVLEEVQDSDDDGGQAEWIGSGRDHGVSRGFVGGHRFELLWLVS